MEENGKIKLNTSSVLNIPFQYYNESFLFVVNGQEFKTTRLISDLLSTKISHMHLNDPTLDTFIVTTKNSGDFSFFLQLMNFDYHDLPENELPFIIETMRILDMRYIEINEKQFVELKKENILNILHQHEPHKDILYRFYQTEIEYVSSHFHELCENHDDEFSSLQISTISDILSDDHLQLKDEDQLIQFINRLCLRNDQYSELYDHVFFANASSNCMEKFVSNFSIEQLDSFIWKNLCDRLILPVNKPRQNSDNSGRLRFVSKNENFPFEENKPFNGIVDFLTKKTFGQIENEINVTASSIYLNDSDSDPINVLLFNDKSKYFYSDRTRGNWLCLEFKNYFVVPSAYTLRTGSFGSTGGHLKSWVLEGSIDNSNWTVIDQQTDCSYLKGSLFFHTFQIDNANDDKFKYLRMRSTGNNWSGNVSLLFEAIEIFGNLIKIH